MDAIVLAGALNSGSLRSISPAQYEAEIEIAGRPMLEYVVLALESVPAIERIVIVGSADWVRSKKGSNLIFTAPGDNLVSSLNNGLDLLRSKNPVLVLTSDIPLITREALEDFLNRCSGKSGDVFYSFVPKDLNDQKYPGVQRTYVKLREGIFTGGNLLLLSPEIVGTKRRMLEKAAMLRKQPLKLCRMLGWWYLLKLLMGSLTIREIEERVEKAFNIKALGIISPFPEVGIDVDKPSDLKLAAEILARK